MGPELATRSALRFLGGMRRNVKHFFRRAANEHDPPLFRTGKTLRAVHDAEDAAAETVAKAEAVAEYQDRVEI
jgi:hypothetical protein